MREGPDLAVTTTTACKAEHPRGTAREVLSAFAKLGLTCFGGPIAHLGYFHRELIEKRRWVDESQYAQLVALCQFLPGPASSQLGFALGLMRAGWRGALAAFLAFTLPSVLLLFAFAQLLPALDLPLGRAAIHGMKLLAVAVVGRGVWTMARRLTPDAPRALIAAAAGAVVLFSGSAAAQLAVVALGALLGAMLCRNLAAVSPIAFTLEYGTRSAVALLTLFAALLLCALAATHAAAPLAAVPAAFYRAGALVFGGGHVVLPLLEETVVKPGWVDIDEFLAGYAAAQAVPGPMFSVAAFLGARLNAGQGGLIGASVSTLAIFLPGFLLTAGALPLWRAIQTHRLAVSALAGVNAAVVGLLAAALYDPVWASTILVPADFAIALIAFAVLTSKRWSTVAALTWCVSAAAVQACLTPTLDA